MFPSLTMRAHAGAVRPCFLRKRPHGKDGYESHCWIRSIVLVFRIERMTGVRTRGFLLGKQACYHCTTSAWPCFFSDTSHGGDVLSASRKRDGWPPSRIDRIRTCDPMLPKHVRYQTAPQSDIFDRTPWLTSYVRALLNAISSDSGTVLSSTTMLSS